MHPHIDPLDTHDPLEPDLVESAPASRDEELHERFVGYTPLTERQCLMDLYGLRERDFA